jgi:nucleoside-diphosphate-sugar epimerase
VTVEVEEARLRRAEQRRMRGDPSKIRAATGWEARTPIEASLADMLDDWKGETGA